MFSSAAPTITEYMGNLYTAEPIYLVTKCLTKDIIGPEMITPLDNDLPFKMILN